MVFPVFQKVLKYIFFFLIIVFLLKMSEIFFKNPISFMKQFWKTTIQLSALIK